MIAAEKLSLIYEKENTRVEALADITFNLRKGSSLSVIGPSGCGKSSLLFIIAGLIKPSTGRIAVEGGVPGGTNTDAALILQDYGLFPWKTVYENACLGLMVRGYNKRAQRDIVIPILEKLGLAEFARHFPTQLSGGQRQRVAIARSLALNPKLLLMDEPLSSLDALTRENLQKFILDIWVRHSLTLVLVTHNIEEAVFLGSHILVMSERPGRVIDIIENPLVDTPGFRQSSGYHQLCSKLRGLLGVVS